jgi:hypothetical protein
VKLLHGSWGGVFNDLYARLEFVQSIYTTTNFSPFGYNLKERNHSLFWMSVARIFRISLDVKYRQPWDRQQVIMSNKSPCSNWMIDGIDLDTYTPYHPVCGYLFSRLLKQTSLIRLSVFIWLWWQMCTLLVSFSSFIVHLIQYFPSWMNDPKFLEYYIRFSVLGLNSQFSTKKKKLLLCWWWWYYVFFHVHVSVKFKNILLISEPDHYAQTGTVFNKS